VLQYWSFIASGLALWVFAGRYAYGGYRALRARQRFEFGAMDGFLLRGTRTSPWVPLVLALVMFVLPIALLARLYVLHRHGLSMLGAAP
jgi:hypothetical protein